MSIAEQINFSTGTMFDVAIYAVIAVIVIVTAIAVYKS